MERYNLLTGAVTPHYHGELILWDDHIESVKKLRHALRQVVKAAASEKPGVWVEALEEARKVLNDPDCAEE